MQKDFNSINICSDIANASTEFEKNNSDLKKLLIIRDILLYVSIAKRIKGQQGIFGTGYPFYAVGENFQGDLPIIGEQIRYNNELVEAVKNSTRAIWSCSTCMYNKGHIMPDLKQICKPCKNMDENLKPRKIINRLPDIDMWMVCDESKIDTAKEVLIEDLSEEKISPSDTDPLRTISDIFEINTALSNGEIPESHLPIDAHIIGYSDFYSLVELVPFEIKTAIENGNIPYLPIHPLSYRKKWQYDDSAYNFIHDYLYALTPFEFPNELMNLLMETRRTIAKDYSLEQLFRIATITGLSSVARRNETPELKDRFFERMDTWKKL